MEVKLFHAENWEDEANSRFSQLLWKRGEKSGSVK